MKRYIYAMSFPRKVAVAHIESYARPLRDHIIKYVLYKDIRRDSVYHWVHDEICSYLEGVSDIKCSSRLKEKDYREYLFGELGNGLPDSRTILRDFRNQYCISSRNPYPDFQLTADVVSRLNSLIITFETICLYYLTHVPDMNQDDWYKVIQHLFK